MVCLYARMLSMSESFMMSTTLVSLSLEQNIDIGSFKSFVCVHRSSLANLRDVVLFKGEALRRSKVCAPRALQSEAMKPGG